MQEFSVTCLKVNQSGKPHNEFTHQILAQSDQQFVRKLAETAQPIRGQENQGFKSVTKKSIRLEELHIESGRNLKSAKERWTDEQTDKPIPMSTSNSIGRDN